MTNGVEKATQILLTAPLREAGEQILDAHFTVHRLWQQSDAAAFLSAHGDDIRGVATAAAYGNVDAQLLDRVPNAEIISSFGVGYDQVDAVAAAQRGMIVTNTPGVLDADVADLALALTLATLRQLPQADRFVRSGQWEAGAFPLSPTLQRRTVGIAGMGRIGKEIARRFEAFGVKLAYHARRADNSVGYEYHDTIVGLALASDVLVVIVPGGNATRHLVNADVLAALGAQGVLINVARGSVVDEAALIEALEKRTILAAGLDVFDDEPRVQAGLLAMDQVVLLPHIGSATVNTRDAMARLVADNLVAWFSGSDVLTPVAESRHLPLRRLTGVMQS